MGIEVLPVDPDDDETMAVRTAIMAAARGYDVPDLPPPCPVDTAGRLRYPGAAMDAASRLAYLDGRPVGVLTCLLTTRENLGNAYLELFVHPGHRRRGAGRALYEFAAGYVAGLGRVRLVSDAVAPLPGGVPRDGAGTAFAAAMGAKPALDDVRRRLDLSTVDIRSLAPVRAPGYTEVHWRDRAPEEHLDDLARLDGRFVLDAPSGDLVVEPFKTDAARVRDEEAAAVARGQRQYHTGIRHDASGALVAWTTLMFTATVTGHAWQHITIVDPDHRGHRLGYRVKVANLAWTLEREPALRVIDTWNAAANTHMIAINEAMGYRPVDLWYQYQLELSQ
jgi:GNAT superfamily N-acetyltransferase